MTTRTAAEIEAQIVDTKRMLDLEAEGSPAHKEDSDRLDNLMEELRMVASGEGAPEHPWYWDRKHGSLYDRGRADSYYGRPRIAHYGGVGGSSGPRTLVTDPAEVAEYQQGYDDNERNGDKKDWGY